jgi:hypothetical protein
MECRGSLIYAHLTSSDLDPDELSHGWLSTLLVALAVLLAAYALIAVVF